MKPIETAETDTRYVGGPGIDDLPSQTLTEFDVHTGLVVRVNRTRWRPDELERTAIALGGDVVLDVLGTVIPPFRVLATAMPIGSPDKVYEAVDGIVSTGVAWSIVAALVEVGIERAIEDVHAWSEEELAAVATWLAEHPDDPATIATWRAAAPEILR